MTATLRKGIKPGLSIVADEITADLYLRLSDLRAEDLNENGNGKTFHARETKLRALAEQLGYTVGLVIVENDEIEKVRKVKGKTTTRKVRGASAFKRKRQPDGTYRVWRPGFRLILERLNTGQSHALIAEDLDRVMRDEYDAADLLDIAARNKVNARSLTGTLTLTNGGTPDEQFMVRMLVNIANKSSTDTARRVAASRERRALAGIWGGGRRPFGFQADDNGRLVKIPHECKVIYDCSRRMLQIDGRTRKRVSLRSLAAELRNMVEVLPEDFIGPPRHLCPTVTGASWSAETLRDILLRPVNANMAVYQDEIYEDVTCYDGDPVVPRDVYDALVTVLNDPARKCGPGQEPKYIGTNRYRCALCTPLGTEPTTAKTVHVCATRSSYRCSIVGHNSINQPKMDAHVVSRLLSLLSLPDAAALFAPTRPDVDVAGLRSEADALRVKLTDLTEMFTDDLISRAQLMAGTEKANARLDAINKELMSAVSEAESPLAGLATHGVDVVTWWEALPLVNKRLVMDSLITVTILPAERGTKRGFDPKRVVIVPKNKKVEVAA